MRFSGQEVFNGLVVGILGAGAIFFYTNRPPKLAYVESARVLEGYKVMHDAKGTYQQQVLGWQANLDTLKQTVQSEIDTYNKQRATLPAAERRTQEERLAERQRQYLGYKKAIADKAEEEEARLTGHAVQKADSLMRVYGKAHNYDIVFAASEAGTVVYGRDGIDITNDVIKALNSTN